MAISPTTSGGHSLPSSSTILAWLCMAGTPQKPTRVKASWYGSVMPDALTSVSE